MSFTNVADREIQSALGFLPSHPHFVGTLDSFIFRYITQPFRRFHPDSLPPLQLVPAVRAKALGEKQKWTQSNLNIQVGATTGERVNLFLVDAVGMAGKQIQFAASWGWNGREPIADSQVGLVMKEKRAMWQKGLITHADNALIAYQILRANGSKVRNLLLKRFPTLIVDEFQDTGWFHGQIILNLLGDPASNGVIVGDPDQAIYEFNGASPALFPEALTLPGSTSMHLATTRRCPGEVCSVAQHLRAGGAPLLPCDGRKGEAFLIEVPEGVKGPSLVLKALRSSYPDEEHVILCRRTDTVGDLLGSGENAAGERKGSPALRNLHDAVLQFRLGKAKSAIEHAESALSRAVFGAETLPLSGGLSEGRNLTILRRSAMGLLLEGHASRDGETMADWGIRMKTRLNAIAQEGDFKAMPGYEPQAVRTFRRNEQENVPAFLPSNHASSSVVGKGHARTIHGAKGETHSSTILFLPDPRQQNLLVSKAWWSADATDQEERRIGYVAITRASRRLVVCAGPKTVRGLKASHPEFVRLLHEIALDQLEDVFGQAGGSGTDTHASNGSEPT